MMEEETERRNSESKKTHDLYTTLSHTGKTFQLIRLFRGLSEGITATTTPFHRQSVGATECLVG